MNRPRINIFIFLALLFSSMISCGQTIKMEDYLVCITDSINEEYEYKNLSGDTIIPLGKYRLCLTDTFKTYAIVLKPQAGFVAIDRQENILYQVFPIDNGPDYVSDGLFRIIENSKIGFADSMTGEVIIKPQFECAWPFKHGVAKVSMDCIEQSNGEYKTWLSDKWYYIDKTGKKVK